MFPSKNARYFKLPLFHKETIIADLQLFPNSIGPSSRDGASIKFAETPSRGNVVEGLMPTYYWLENNNNNKSFRNTVERGYFARRGNSALI